MTFNDVVDAIQNFSADEKLEIQQLLQQYFREERRGEIAANFEQAKTEHEQGKLKFSADMSQLKNLLLED
ncbi:MAG: hypothetical protein MUF49_03405 [Oculatellaceae cyanobacterium Prado106]|jgi:hypothetical protein|nr:hypothetical protein [Oculatellaceae cyanobacterium Prado106]